MKNTSDDHGLLYLSSASVPDSSAGYDSEDWLQVGYGKGAVDTVDSSSISLYVEENDDTSGKTPNGKYPVTDYNGTHTFDVAWDGAYQAGSKTRGQYEACYTTNCTIIGYSYLLDPSTTYSFSVLEGYAGTESGSYCPEFNNVFVGAASGSGNYTTSSELEVQTTTGDIDLWNSSSEPNTTANTPAGYSEFVTHAWDGYEANGGGS
jgi:hypothetical protein